MTRKHLIYAILCLGLSLPSCIKGGNDDECFSFVKFVYDYNMAFEDLFHHQACKMDLYLFDDDGIFIRKVSDEIAGGTFPRNYYMKLPLGLTYPLHIVAWSGLYGDRFETDNLVPGVSSEEDLTVSLMDSYNLSFDSELKGLWHGTGSIMKGSMQQSEVITINLKKNTNSLRIVLQSLEEDADFDVADFSFLLESVNGSYDYKNQTSADGPCWQFRPFFTANDPNAGAIAEIHTLRLLEDRDNRFTVSFDPQNETILDINLNTYINALKMSRYGSMPLQEYMDREDEYRIIIFIKSITEPGGQKKWVATDITINDWFIREQEE